MKPLIVATLCASLVLSAHAAFGQVSTATILGVVRDASGGVLPGVTVMARNIDTGIGRETVSGVDGTYRLPGVPVGRYEVRAELAGFKTAIRSGITLG